MTFRASPVSCLPDLDMHSTLLALHGTWRVSMLSFIASTLSNEPQPEIYLSFPTLRVMYLQVGVQIQSYRALQTTPRLTLQEQSLNYEHALYFSEWNTKHKTLLGAAQRGFNQCICKPLTPIENAMFLSCVLSMLKRL